MTRLRIVRGTHDVALEFVAKNARVAALSPAGHGLADERKRLVTIEAAQLDDRAVQCKAVVGKLRLAKASGTAVVIHQLSPAEQPNVDGVEIGMGEVPEIDVGKVVEMNGVRRRLCSSFRRRNTQRGFRHGTITVAQIHLKRQAFARRFHVHEKAVHIKARVRA